MALRVVVFDMDGTLFDSSDTVPMAYIATVQELTGRKCSLGEIVTNCANSGRGLPYCQCQEFSISAATEVGEMVTM